MSSETPADRPSASSEVPGEVQPRRALDPDAQDETQHDTTPVDDGYDEESETAHSPSTPVRLRDRLPARTRKVRPDEGEQPGTENANWSWDLPPTPDAERPQWAPTPASHEAAVEPAEPTESERPAGSEAQADQGVPAEQRVPAEQEQPGQEQPGAPEQTAGPESQLSEPAAPDQEDSGSQIRRPQGADAWLTAFQPAAEFAEHPTELIPTGPEPGDVPTGPDPAGGAAPAGTVPESIAADAGPAQDGPTEQGTGQRKPGQNKTGQNKTGKNAGGKGRKGALALKGRQRFKVLQSVGPRTPRPDVPDQSHLPSDQRTDLAVRVTDLSITYRTSFEKKPTLRQAVVRFGRGQRAVREIKALQNISFEVRTGRSVGIIGRNGAGKSTLMRAMAGILPPTSGTVEVWGRASTLLALGVGFNNSLSGRENIILGGLASGMSLDEVEDRANEIAEWTELGDFIDMPMRTYSSGMASRVAFAVAVHMEPDILMIDEGLSTGDAHFKDKASAKMSELRDKARAMFLVSHGLGSIKELCDEAIWIDKGHLMERGEPEEVVEKYLHNLKARRHSTTFEDV